MRRHIVEGEPGIFPSPVTRVLQGIGGLFRRKEPAGDSAPPEQAPADPDPDDLSGDVSDDGDQSGVAT